MGTKVEQRTARDLVKKRYGEIASRDESCCEPSCCLDTTPRQLAEKIGYDSHQLDGVPEEANMGLGCGNPTAMAALRPGDVVLDLGSGAGLDAFIAARQVQPEGRVIGVDMTPEMLERARTNAVKAGLARVVDFREGYIEHLPVASDTIDVVISNCVINLSPDKGQVFREAFRVLKPGGRMAISDIILSEPLPAEIAESAASYVACIGGALTEAEYLGLMQEAGFVDIEWNRNPAGGFLVDLSEDPEIRAAIEHFGMEKVQRVADQIWSYRIEARKDG